MSKLSPELRELVLATKSASLPTAADRVRGLDGLRILLGETAVAGAASVVGVARGSSPAFRYSKVAGLGVVGLSVLGGLWLFAARHHGEPSNATGLVSSAVTESSESIALGESRAALPSRGASAPDTHDVAIDANRATERVEVVPAAAHRTRDKLAAEVELLSRAETALHNGKPGAALQVLNEHARKFSNGLLKEERIAARVQALCALGYRSEADAQMALLSPKSLHGDRVRAACNAGR